MVAGGVDTGRVTHHPMMHRDSPIKEPVRAATTANGTFASAFDNGSSVDGVTLATGDRVLLKDQTAGETNGIYIVRASGEPVRAYDMDTDTECMGALVFVSEGTANANKFFVCTTNDPIVLETTALVFAELGTGAYQPLDTDLTDIAGLTRNRGDIIRGGAAAWQDLALGTDGQHLTSDGTDVVWEDNLSGLGMWYGDPAASAAVTTGGPKGFMTVPWNCTVYQWDAEGDLTSTSTFDIKKRAHGGGAATSICAAAKPNISASTEGRSSTLTGWTTTLTAGDHLYLYVDVNNNAKLVGVTLWVKKT